MNKLAYLCLKVVVILAIVGYSTCNICVSKTTCKDCITASSQCAWCLVDVNQRNIDPSMPRCNLIEKHKGTCPNILNPQNKIDLKQVIHAFNITDIKCF